MSDTWSDILAVKTKQNSLRAKLQQRKKEREGLAKELGVSPSSTSTASSASSSTTSVVDSGLNTPTSKASFDNVSVPVSAPNESTTLPKKEIIHPEIEKKLPYVLCDMNLALPAESSVITGLLNKMLGQDVSVSIVEELLEKFSAQQILKIGSDKTTFTITSVDLSKLSALYSDVGGTRKRKRDDDDDLEEEDTSSSKHQKKNESALPDDSIESLLNTQSAKEKENKKVNEEILQILSQPTAKEQYLVEKFKSRGGAQLKEFCQFGTREECKKINNATEPCNKLHFRKIIHKHTDESLGDCSFLNTCFHMETCKYVHYEIDHPDKKDEPVREIVKYKVPEVGSNVYMFPPQWIQSDLRFFDMSTIGKCAVVMADPPWDIHMELPYGTMSDDEMRRLNVPGLQDEGFIFLWVTGRAMELGRECLELWGYKRIDELIWVKTNQLQRIIRTGRTGHWLNHGKEHCLVGVKGEPKGANRGLDCDILVAEVRATSHKPDEIYGIIERLSPGTRKVELFGRPHNVQPNWITLGNQVDGVRLKDPDVVKLFKERYPDGNCMEPPKNR
ncbi:hypothetical protein SNE40_008270 [Patella caerulea]|uniref:mRNA m(6)A methyltransferase n=1 Tax=Patella caerulea TaxID=87958 RepID=A0AAN8JVA3_PATCE